MRTKFLQKTVERRNHSDSNYYQQTQRHGPNRCSRHFLQDTRLKMAKEVFLSTRYQAILSLFLQPDEALISRISIFVYQLANTGASKTRRRQQFLPAFIQVVLPVYANLFVFFKGICLNLLFTATHLLRGNFKQMVRTTSEAIRTCFLQRHVILI